MQTRSFILLAVLVAAAALVAVAAWRLAAPPSAGPAQGSAAVGGPFQLVDQTGRPVDEGVLEGKWSAVFFGFTYCPDVCPTTLQTLAAAKDQLGPRGEDLQIVLVSVDPERDTPEQLAAYLEAQGLPNALGLTGTPEQVAGVASAYRVYYEKAGEGPDYLINHSSPTYLMDPKGRFARVIPYGLPPEEAAHQIGEAMRAG